MGMPKAPVNEHNRAMFRQDNVGLTWEVMAM